MHAKHRNKQNVQNMNETCQNMNDACHTYGRVMSLIGLRHATRKNESCHSYFVGASYFVFVATVLVFKNRDRVH